MAYTHPIIGPLYQAESWLYAMNMDAYPTSKRLLEAFIFAALAGGVGYAVTSWLAPENVSAGVVAAVVAAIAGVASIAPSSLLANSRRDAGNPWSPPKDLYNSLEFRLTNQTGLDAHEYRPEDDDAPPLSVNDSDS